MKKIIVLLLILLTMVCTVSCETVGEGTCIGEEVSDLG